MARLRPSKYLQDLPKMVRNLRRLLREATPEEIADGLKWYPRGQMICALWQDCYGIDADVIACVIAAISPQCEWDSNVVVADDVLNHRPTKSIGGALPKNIGISQRVLADRATTLDGGHYFKAGDKVKSFAKNLKGFADFVTIDSHAAQAAMNDPLHVFRFRTRDYLVIADAYRRAAKLDGYRPCDYQAILWLVWKRKYSPEAKRSLIHAAKKAA